MFCHLESAQTTLSTGATVGISAVVTGTAALVIGVLSVVLVYHCISKYRSQIPKHEQQIRSSVWGGACLHCKGEDWAENECGLWTCTCNIDCYTISLHSIPFQAWESLFFFCFFLFRIYCSNLLAGLFINLAVETITHLPCSRCFLKLNSRWHNIIV